MHALAESWPIVAAVIGAVYFLGRNMATRRDVDSLRTDIHGIDVRLARIEVRLARMDVRLEHVEKRLGLPSEPSPAE